MRENKKIKLFFSELKIWLLFAGGFALIYAPVLFTPYLFSDDYCLFAQAIRGVLYPELKGAISAGRPVYAGALFFGFGSVGSIVDFRIIRLISILGIATTAWVFYLFLSRAGWSRKAALACSFVLGTMPPFQLYASWAVCFPYSWVTAITGLSVYLVNSSLNFSLFWKRLGYFLVAMVIMLIAFNTYQPAAMFFWIFAAIKLFGNKKLSLNINRYLVYYGIMFFITAGFAFILQRVFMSVYGSPEIFQRAKLTFDVIARLKWFIREPLLNALNFSNIYPSIWLAVVAGLVIAIGLWLYIPGFEKRKIIWFLVMLLLIPLTYLTSLVVAEGWAIYRTQVALTSLLTLYMFFAIRGLWQVIPLPKWVEIKNVLMIGIPIITGLWATYNVTVGFAIPQYTELTMIQSQISQNPLAKTKIIYLIPAADWHDYIPPMTRYDEFGLPSTIQNWARENAVYVLLNENNPSYRDIPVKIINSLDDVKSRSKGITIVDLRQLRKLKLFFNPS